MKIQNQIDEIKSYFTSNEVTQLDNNSLWIGCMHDMDEAENTGLLITLNSDSYSISQMDNGSALSTEEFDSFADLVDHIEDNY